MLPSGIASDEQFLRRATIDLIGLLPTEEEYAAFINDADPEKRTKLVDRLLERRGRGRAISEARGIRLRRRAVRRPRRRAAP